MNVEFAAEDLAFQAEVKAFIDENLTPDMREVLQRSPTGHLSKTLQIEWQQRLAKKGWAVPNWPAEWGGPSWTATQKYIFDLEMSKARRRACYLWRHHGGAGHEVRLPGAKGAVPSRYSEFKVWWCQGYSEPGSGSDLASLDHGQARRRSLHRQRHETWTTLGQHADMIFCLVRTSKEEKRQDGISFLLIDMKSEGISVNPIVTIDNPPPGHQEINTIFFENVKVPVENLIGEEGKGWTYAKYLLEFERGNAYAPALLAKLDRIRSYADQLEASGEPLATDPGYQRKLADTEIAIRAMEFTELRILSALSSGQNVGRNPPCSSAEARSSSNRWQNSHWKRWAPRAFPSTIRTRARA